MGANFIFTSPKAGLTAGQMRGRLASNSANKTELEVSVPEQSDLLEIDTAQINANVTLDPILAEFEKERLLEKMASGEVKGTIRKSQKRYGDPKEWDYGWLAIKNDDLKNVSRDDVKAALIEYARTGKNGKGERLGIVGDWHDDTDYTHILVATNRNYIEDGVVKSLDMSNGSIIAEETDRLSGIIATKTGGKLNLESFIHSQNQNIGEALRGLTVSEATAEATAEVQETASNAIEQDAKEQGTTPELLAIERELAIDNRELAKLAERIAAKNKAKETIIENKNLHIENNTLKNNLTEKEQELATVQGENAGHVEIITTLEVERVTSSERIETLETVEQELAEKLTSTSSNLNETKFALKEMSEEFEIVQSDLATQAEETQKVKSTLESANSENAALKEQVEKLTHKNTELSLGIESERSMFKDVVSGYKAQVEQLSQQIESLKDDFEIKIQQAVDAVANAKDAIISSVQGKLETMKTEKDTANEKLERVSRIPNIDELLEKQEAAILEKEKKNVVEKPTDEKPAAKKMSRVEKAKAKAKAVTDKINERQKGADEPQDDRGKEDDLEM